MAVCVAAMAYLQGGPAGKHNTNTVNIVRYQLYMSQNLLNSHVFLKNHKDHPLQKSWLLHFRPKNSLE